MIGACGPYFSQRLLMAWVVATLTLELSLAVGSQTLKAASLQKRTVGAWQVRDVCRIIQLCWKMPIDLLGIIRIALCTPNMYIMHYLSQPRACSSTRSPWVSTSYSVGKLFNSTPRASNSKKYSTKGYLYAATALTRTSSYPHHPQPLIISSWAVHQLQT